MNLPNLLRSPFSSPAPLLTYPFFSLAKRTRYKPIIYNFDHVQIRVEGADDLGIATIWDSDILLWAATVLTTALKAGRPFSNTVRFHPYSLLREIERHTAQHHYRLLEAALNRLHTTRVTTTLTGLVPTPFSWIDSWRKLPPTLKHKYLCLQSSFF